MRWYKFGEKPINPGHFIYFDGLDFGIGFMEIKDEIAYFQLANRCSFLLIATIIEMNLIARWAPLDKEKLIKLSAKEANRSQTKFKLKWRNNRLKISKEKE